MRRDNLVGQKFGRLTVVSFSHINMQGNSTWKVVCDCGKESLVGGGKLKGRHTTSCGCYKIEVATKHGASHTRMYKAWHSMVDRCTKPTNRSFYKYGARGIKVCDRWLKFENFIEDMGYRPGNLSLDRIDNNGNYEPSNCRWADASTQATNTRRNTDTAGIRKKGRKFWVHMSLFGNHYVTRGYQTIEKAKEIREKMMEIKEYILLEYREKSINVQLRREDPSMKKGGKPHHKNRRIYDDTNYRVTLMESFKDRILDLR